MKFKIGGIYTERDDIFDIILDKTDKYYIFFQFAINQNVVVSRNDIIYFFQDMSYEKFSSLESQGFLAFYKLTVKFMETTFHLKYINGYLGIIDDHILNKLLNQAQFELNYK